MCGFPAASNARRGAPHFEGLGLPRTPAPRRVPQPVVVPIVIRDCGGAGPVEREEMPLGSYGPVWFTVSSRHADPSRTAYLIVWFVAS